MISTFHHHFYPFPERHETGPDKSFIRNYTDVLSDFQRYNVKLVLHGHKHTPVQRAITDKKFFNNPDSIIYVLAAGSIGCKGVDNLSFHWLEIFDKTSIKLLSGRKYDFNGEEDAIATSIILPPKHDEKLYGSSELKDLLERLAPKLYQNYLELINEFEQIVYDNRNDRVLEIIGLLLTTFPEITKILEHEPKRILLILLVVNHRVILLKGHHRITENRLEEMIENIEGKIRELLPSKKFQSNMIEFIRSISNDSLDDNYPGIVQRVKHNQKIYGAFVSITVFLADLFLTLSEYGEFYFHREKLDLKINVKLKKEEFHNQLPSNSIRVESDVDRRAIYLNFNTKDPTVHKVAVLIVKDFEMRLSKLEESLKTIKLKLYYISPKVAPINYDLENFHFDAYIPTLLPLLTGDNLYSQKEVFIRELVQNSIDATLLRKKLEPRKDFCTDINIELGEEKRGGKMVKFFRITDNGVGMSSFTIERYFTSIGRSFYVSEEFKELKEKEGIKYNAISNFGIGFLSSFMVTTEILVRTKNIMDNEAFEIEIPNYEGCFFVKKINQNSAYGTEITLFEDKRNLLDFDKFSSYINGTFRGVPVNINININGCVDHTLPAYELQRDIFQKIHEDQLNFYVPFSEEQKTILKLSLLQVQDLDFEEFGRFGVFFDFADFPRERYNTTIYNQGLLVPRGFKRFLSNHKLEEELHPNIIVNFPSSFIQLDVAREIVSHLRVGFDFGDILTHLEYQVSNFLLSPSKKLENTYLFQLQAVKQYLQSFYHKDTVRIGKWESLGYSLQVELKDTSMSIKIINNKDIGPISTDPDVLYLSNKLIGSMEHFVQFNTRFNRFLLSKFTLDDNSVEWRGLVSIAKRIAHAANSREFYHVVERIVTSNIEEQDHNLNSRLILETIEKYAKPHIIEVLHDCVYMNNQEHLFNLNTRRRNQFAGKNDLNAIFDHYVHRKKIVRSRKSKTKERDFHLENTLDNYLTNYDESIILMRRKNPLQGIHTSLAKDSNLLYMFAIMLFVNPVENSSWGLTILLSYKKFLLRNLKVKDLPTFQVVIESDKRGNSEKMQTK